MRTQINKLSTKHSTKAERKFCELLKKLHVPFRAKIKIAGREVDFLIGKLAIEIDSHKQDVEKNYLLLKEGFIPIHFNNWEINDDLIEWITITHKDQINGSN